MMIEVEEYLMSKLKKNFMDMDFKCKDGIGSRGRGVQKHLFERMSSRLTTTIEKTISMTDFIESLMKLIGQENILLIDVRDMYKFLEVWKSPITRRTTDSKSQNSSKLISHHPI
eukprot:scaffold874_cov75-Skeletonema_marinoi.AAC.2